MRVSPAGVFVAGLRSAGGEPVGAVIVGVWMLGVTAAVVTSHSCAVAAPMVTVRPYAVEFVAPVSPRISMSSPGFSVTVVVPRVIAVVPPPLMDTRTLLMATELAVVGAVNETTTGQLKLLGVKTLVVCCVLTAAPVGSAGRVNAGCLSTVNV